LLDPAIACTLILTPIAAANSEVPYLLGDRLGWVCAVCLLGSLLVMVVALTASILLLNPAGALAMYFVAVPMTAIVASVVPMFSWISPFTAAFELATLNDYLVPYPGIVSLLLWAALFAAAGRRVVTHDVGRRGAGIPHWRQISTTNETVRCGLARNSTRGSWSRASAKSR
jgi:hypothetical protein